MPSFDPGAAKDFFDRTRNVAFDPGATAYHRGNARWLAELSRLMYVRNANARAKFLPKGSVTETVLRGTLSTQAAIFHGAGFDVLAFRGTQLNELEGFIRDAIVDISALLGAWQPPPGLVHVKMRDELLAVWPEIEARLGNRNVPLFFTGHSLGGALATLATAKSTRRVPRATYTFGAPRVGDLDFVKSIRTPIHRVENKRDPIPLVPRIQKYAHAGTPQQFSAQGEVPSFGLLPAFVKQLFDVRMIDQIAKRVRSLSPLDLVDHDPLVYVTNV